MNEREQFKWNDETKTLFVRSKFLLSNETTKMLRKYAKEVFVIVSNTYSIIYKAAFSLTTFPKLQTFVITEEITEDVKSFFSGIDNYEETRRFPIIFPVLTKLFCATSYPEAIAKAVPQEFLQMFKHKSLEHQFVYLTEEEEGLFKYNRIKLDAVCCVYLYLRCRVGIPKDILKMITALLLYKFSWTEWRWQEQRPKKRIKK